jgi:hypothetical protein
VDLGKMLEAARETQEQVTGCFTLSRKWETILLQDIAVCIHAPGFEIRPADING